MITNDKKDKDSVQIEGDYAAIKDTLIESLENLVCALKKDEQMAMSMIAIMTIMADKGTSCEGTNHRIMLLSPRLTMKGKDVLIAMNVDETIDMIKEKLFENNDP